MAHENLKTKLVDNPGKNFIANLTHKVYEWSVKIPSKYYRFRIFEEVTVREYSGNKNRWGDDKPEHYRFDCVFFVEPGWKALNQRQVYTVGVELKGSKADLLGDKKIEHYLGYTDFFFIGVPTPLLAYAVKRAEDERIGVFSVDDGKIAKMPKRMSPTDTMRRNLLEQIMFSRMFDEDFKNCVSFKVDDIEIEEPTFKENIGFGFVEYPNSSNKSTGEALPGISDSKSISDHLTSSDENIHQLRENTQEELEADKEAEKEAAREKEQLRREKHDKKVATLEREISSMNEDVPHVVSYMLSGLSLCDQRIYHAIRRNGGIQAQNISAVLPSQEGIEPPSLATVKRSIRVLSENGLIEREGSRKTGRYVIKEIDCKSESCQVCAKSPLCRQFQKI